MRTLRRIGPRPLKLARVIWHRLRREVRERVLRVTYPRRVAAIRAQAPLWLPPVDLPTAAGLPEGLGKGAQLIRTEAEQIVEHRVEFLGSGLVDLGHEIDWQRDFKSGYRWPGPYYADVEVTRLDDDSDAKVPWELSRCHHLLTLARAARLYEDERCSDEFERQVRSWIR